MLKKLLTTKVLGAILALIILPSIAIGQAIFITPQGGTGTGLVPSEGDVLVGNADGAYTPTAFTSLTIGEGMLNAVNSPTDELCLTYEATVGDFEWQTCSTGGGDHVSIDGVEVSDPDFVSSGDIDFVNTSNTITALINAGSIIEPDLNADVAPADGDFLQYDSTGTNFTWRIASELISDIGFGNVENTALSTWAGSTALTTLGTIGTGVWQATALTDTYVSDTLTIGAGSTVADGALSANVSLLGSTIAPTELAVADFGDFTCNGTICSLDASYLTTVDISANTNLAVTSPITLTGDNLGINQSLLSITESQISDLGAYLTTITGSEGAFTGWDKDASDDFDGVFSSLTSIPTGLSDGDDDTNASTICTGTNVYLDGEGNCDTIADEVHRFQVQLLANDTAQTTGTSLGGDYRIHSGAITVTGVGAYVDTAGTTGVATIDINEAGTSILSTKITIDSGEKTSETAVTAPVVSDTTIGADNAITIDVDGIHTTPAEGLKVWIEYTIN
jgi:hypothetical protein